MVFDSVFGGFRYEAIGEATTAPAVTAVGLPQQQRHQEQQAQQEHHQRREKYSPSEGVRKVADSNIALLLRVGCSLCVLLAGWGLARGVKNNQQASPHAPNTTTSTPPETTSGDLSPPSSFVSAASKLRGDVARNVHKKDTRGEDRGTSWGLRNIRVFTESYRNSTDTSLYSHYGRWIAEPHRESTLEVDVTWASWATTGNNMMSNDGSHNDGMQIRWEVEGDIIGSGTAITTRFGAPRPYECSVVAYRTAEEFDDDGKGKPMTGEGSAPPRSEVGKPGTTLLHHPVGLSGKSNGNAETLLPLSSSRGEVEIDRLDFVVVVKYVRREIRTLTDRDRETFFNAVSVMQRVPSAVGQAIYGPKYYSKDFFTRIHLYYGGRRDCDHWHAGAGFVTSHVALTLMYEQSLQAINPSIAIPYWDVTVEGTLYEWTTFRTSSVFSDDWFGSASPDNVVRTPTRGRFAFVPAMIDSTEYSEVHNAYGILRSPWNTDRNPFLTRSDTLCGFKNDKKPSGCKKFVEAETATSWMKLTEEFNGGAHGNIHGLLGGTWSAEANEYASRTSNIVMPFVHSIYITQKLMWRKGMIDCPEACSIETPWEKCTCTCSEAAIEGRTSAEFLQAAGALGKMFYDKNFHAVRLRTDSEGKALEILKGYTKEETNDIYDALVEVLCIPTKAGSHLEASSPNDVTFWVLHPGFDRVWHLKRLKHTAGFNETWIDDAGCYGHNSSDYQPFHSLFDAYDDGNEKEDAESSPETHGQDGVDGRGSSGNGARNGDAGSVGAEIRNIKRFYTNQELYDLVDPQGRHSPYIYDNFEWPRCEVMSNP